MAKAKISIVIPVYNEQDSVAELHKEVTQVLQGLGYGYEIIFIDDGSTDRTLAELEKLSLIRIIAFTKNFGKSQALQAGFDAATGDHIITMDGDLQDDPHEIPNFIHELEAGLDLVCGWKKNRLDSISKRMASKIANRVTRFFTHTNVHDMNCGFKIYRRDVVKNLYLYGDMHRYIPSVVANMGFVVGEMPVHHRVRRYGASKYGFKRFINSFFDFVTLIFLRKFTDRPMHFFGLFGLILSCIGFVILGYLSWIKILGAHIGERPLLLLGVLLMVIGFQLFSLGFIGELLIRQSAAQRRNFIIRKDIVKI